MRIVSVHGCFQRAWCWSRLIPELKRLGHDAVAMDLPGHRERRAEESTLATHRDAIVKAMQPDDVVVGHSGGGFALDRVGHFIYLAAGLPLHGQPMLRATGGHGSGENAEQLNKTMSSEGVRQNHRGRQEWIDFQAAGDLF